jgi:SAM-dependent methyltransferase
LRGLKNGSDRNVGLVTDVIGKLGVKSALDIGCGYGLFIKALEDKYPHMTLAACDVSPTQVAETKKFLGEASKVTVKESDNFRLPFKDKELELSYTIVVCVCIPKEKIEDFLKEIFRVTSGYCLFLENSRGWTGWSYHEHDYPALFEKMGMKWRALKDVTHDERPGRLYLVQVDPARQSPPWDDGIV